MNVTRSHMVGAGIAFILWFVVGLVMGGWYWLPFVVMCVPTALVVAGLVYGLVSGTGDVNSLDDAVSEGMAAKTDTDMFLEKSRLSDGEDKDNE